METKLTLKNSGTWVREVRASFRKVVAFDLLFFGLGVLVGVGIGAYIVPALSK